MALNDKKAKIILVFAVLILCLISILQITFKIAPIWQNIPPQVTDDDPYYHARMSDVVKGHPFLGNPYFLEHRAEMSPAFFVPDWISAAPMFIGLSLTATLIINFIFWATLLVILIYVLLRRLDMTPNISVAISLFSFIEVYWLIIRPVSIQTVFPSYILFLLALCLWFKNPGKRNSWLLIFASALTFYLYTYLWQIVIITLGLVLAYEILMRNWQRSKRLLIILLGIFIVSLPVIIYTYLQINSAYYWETITRIGLVQSHLPTIYSYLYGRWVIAVLIIGLMLRKKITEEGGIYFVQIFSGLGLFVMAISNLLTGKELETAIHVGRFITIWVAIFTPINLIVWWKNRKNLSIIVNAIILVLAILLIGFLTSNLFRSLPFSSINRQNYGNTQEYAEPLEWLNKNASEDSVIWANENLSAYVPIVTKHYVLWNHLGALHLLSTKESEDRFLTAWIGTTTTATDLVSYYRDYEGAGPVWKYGDDFYKNKLSCFFGLSCHADQSLEQWIGSDFIMSLQHRQKAIKTELTVKLKQFKVNYAVADKSRNEDLYFNTLDILKPVFNNERFVIYKVSE